MRLYLDTSALVKLVVEEPETAALQAFLDASPDDALFTAALSRIELMRAVGRAGDAARAQARARALLDAVDTVALSRTLLDDAGLLGPERLRSLDAIHLAAAMRAGTTLRSVVTYDLRMADAAQRLGMQTSAPN
ncbi:ribonuclease VapC [Mycolicibacterium madagascariense]|uniref:Ribonuclease VapC n=1 Tax=Mycolicibacterium madagascariense TaxID=212765 RepID=A0A7I7XCX3_9MYCO|nr:type II toxin-antitoxin system VapC family toxin [Mycolicibacterium madagascariense]MCV7014761.1 type II toxin-antitoxin system VapC family toxin [Mycolicibacterium madagascariense]BBZ26471.1 ribonuclease VapC [Mycolicibacterium madagascariense]